MKQSQQNKPQYTQGQWRVGYDDDSGIECITSNNEFIAKVEMLEETVIFSANDLTPEQDANLNLIAAAPDMYEALESFPMPDLNNDMFSLQYNEQLRDWINNTMNKALAKARGESWTHLN